MSDTREALAAIQHEIWAHWMRYQFGLCIKHVWGSLIIPGDRVKRWKRQMDTAYTDLTEREKDSDREQADKVLAVINPMMERITELQRRAVFDAATASNLRQLVTQRDQYIAELEGVIKCACDFLDANQKEAGIGGDTAFMLRAALGRKP